MVKNLLNNNNYKIFKAHNIWKLIWKFQFENNYNLKIFFKNILDIKDNFVTNYRNCFYKE